MTLNNLKIGARLATAFGLVLAMLCGVAGIGLYASSQLNQRAAEISDDWMPGVRWIGELRSQANASRRTSLRHVMESDAQGKAVQLQAHDKAMYEELPQALSQIDKLTSAPEEAQLVKAIKAALAVYAEDEKKLLALSDKGDSGLAEARRFAVGPSATSFAALAQALDADVEWQTAGAQAAKASAEATFQRMALVNIAGVVIALATGIALATVITRSITRPIARAVDVASAVASGDLTKRVAAQGRDEAAELLRSLTDMMDRLSGIVGQVRNSSDSIATGSAQIATGNADLSQRTEEQAGALQQTAATMDELGTTVRHNADNAKQASQLAGSASSVATRGGDVVSRVVATMKGIGDSSKRISDIIGVIDGISFQTNILALNAAVEAARAGEQGRGFAVVAGEVRVLAKRSAEAAKEIKSLITHSVAQVDQGTTLVDEAGRTMSEIVAAISRVNDIVAEISAASEEQSSGVSQVGQAVSQMDQVTQQNAALVEESAAAAESLKQQAESLVGAVSQFRLASPMHINAGPPASLRPAFAMPGVGARVVATSCRQAGSALARPGTTPGLARPTAAEQHKAQHQSQEWEAF